ncbi:MAG TPA: restriction endonuclease subunit S [Microbacterium sp.]|nr:restriction endonuclease subunit S [Microbacterium sp.]
MRLDAVCSHVVDCEHKTAPIDESGEYFAVGTPAMRDHRIEYAEARRISRDTFEAWTRRLRPQPGDLLLAREAPVGPIVRLPESAHVAPGQRTVLLRPDAAATSSTYLYYLLRSPRMQAELLLKAEGSTVHHLNVADIRALEVDLPPLAEQQAIAEVLGALDDKIAANTALAESLTRLSALECRALAASTTRSVPLADLVTTQYGVTTSAVVEPQGTGLVRVTDINKRPWIEWDSVPGCSLDKGVREKYLLNPGDIVVARMADPGKAAWISLGDPPAVFASYLVRLQATIEYHAPFIYEFLRGEQYRRYCEGAMQGSVQKNMNAKVIVGTTMPLPDRAALREYAGRFHGLRALMSSALRENRTLAATRDALLPQLMSGKLRVRDAERIATEAGV